MRKILPILLSLSLFLTAGFAVFAEDSSNSGSTTSDHGRGNKLIQRLDTRELKVQNVAQNRVEKIEDLKAKIASRTAELKARLAAFRDQRRAQKVQRVSDTLNMINKNQTDQMNKHLDKMSEILSKVQNRVNTASSSADPTSANTAISSASAAIATAKDAVAAQAAKDYTLTISDEASAGAQAKAMRNQLHSDLMGVRKLVIDAKQAVANAIRTTATTLGGIK